MPGKTVSLTNFHGRSGHVSILGSIGSDQKVESRDYPFLPVAGSDPQRSYVCKKGRTDIARLGREPETQSGIKSALIRARASRTEVSTLFL